MFQKAATLMLRVVFHYVSSSIDYTPAIVSNNRTVLSYDTDVQILQINDVDGHKNVMSTTLTKHSNNHQKKYIFV